MILVTKETTSFPSLTPKYIADIVLDRGWKMEQLYEGSSSYKLTRTDGKELLIFSSTPPTTSFLAHHIAQDKFACYSLLAEHNIPQPLSFVVESIDRAIVRGTEHIQNGKLLVVKPLDKAHGMGVTTAIGSVTSLRTALERAFKLSKRVIVQEHVDGNVDLRIVVIDGKVRAALRREPASVLGDGTSTLRELIQAENTSELRGDGYSKPLSKIKMSAVKAYLGERLNEVPAKGQKVQVVGVANMGVGGETYDVTDDLPEWLNHLAVSVCGVVGLPVGGVDFLLKATPRADSIQTELDPKLIEVNKCPALFMHEIPTHGTPRHVIADYIEYLEKI